MKPPRHPVNKQAALAISARGVHYQPKAQTNVDEWDVPPPTLPVPSSEPSLIGKKFGRFTVVGYLGWKKTAKKGSDWLVRCLCGRYTHRRTRTILWSKGRDRCSQCRALIDIRRSYIFHKFGRQVSDEDIEKGRISKLADKVSP